MKVKLRATGTGRLFLGLIFGGGQNIKIARGVCCCSTRCWAVFLLFIFYFFVIILDDADLILHAYFVQMIGYFKFEDNGVSKL